MTMPGVEPTGYTENEFLESISGKLAEAVESRGGDRTSLVFRQTKVKNSAGYTAVKLDQFTVFRICMRGNQNYISVPSVFLDIIPEDMQKKQLSSDSKYVRIPIDDGHGPESYTDLLVRIAAETVERYPKEWDCCSRYMECSDKGFCVHPDKTFALGCGYRKILNSGKIYFGKNRNI